MNFVYCCHGQPYLAQDILCTISKNKFIHQSHLGWGRGGEEREGGERGREVEGGTERGERRREREKEREIIFKRNR